MHHQTLVPIAGLAGVLGAQNLTLTTAVIDPVPEHNAVAAYAFGSGSLWAYLPPGPVQFPAQVIAQLWGRASLDLTHVTGAQSQTLIATEYAAEGEVACALHTTVSTPSPARIDLGLAATMHVIGIPFHLGIWFEVNVDGGPVEFSHARTAATFWQPIAPTSLCVLADSRGTPVEWSSRCGIADWIVDTRFELRFAEPVQEPTYGAACGGELGGQLVPSQPFARVLVASFPATASLAWFVGGAQQAQTFVPGFACPLLTETAIVIGAPLVNGANGRRFAELDLALPPVPGMTWFAQGIAFVGTNGVRLQT